MATRVDKTSGLAQLPESSIIRRLKSLAGKRQAQTDFLGLKRSSALGDVSDPGKSLNNILGKINEDGEGYNGVDWLVTRDFTLENITKEFLTPLFGVSASDGVVSLNPRIRIEDRISQVDSFSGIDSFSGLHRGPNAQFYRSPRRQSIGFIKFGFDEVTGIVTPSSVKSPDKVTNLVESEILGDGLKVVLSVESYDLDESGASASLAGAGVFLALEEGEGWKIEEGLGNLIGLKDILGATRFSNTFFRLAREYSTLNPPPWYKDSPSTGSADLSESLIRGDSGEPVVAKGYWYSRSSIEDRWSAEERRTIGEETDLDNVVQDSNMRWESLPKPLRGQTSNWGIRWDGYLYVTPGKYCFQVETNVNIKIDVYLDQWTNVFVNDTETSTPEKFVSSSTFDSDDLDPLFKYFFSESEWEGYIPITIRMYVGGVDKADPALSVPTEPNLFIRTAKLDNDTTFYSKSFAIEAVGGEIVSSELASILEIVDDSNSSVTYQLVEKDGLEIAVPIEISIAPDGAITPSDLEDGEYVLKVTPALDEEAFVTNIESLWRGRVASPRDGQTTYSYLVSGDYSPNQQKTSFDLRPEWWRVSQGHPYDRGLIPSTDNTPLDGFVLNEFDTELKSRANGVGLYGDGGGVYSPRPNIIIGEARYSETDIPGSNYTGITISPNRLGEGGNLIVDAFPVNNATYSSLSLLGANDLGGDPNHKTSSFDKVDSQVARIYLWTSGPEELQGRYYLHPDLASITSSDNPTTYGLPPFSFPDWLSPITISATQVCDNADFVDASVKDFVAPLIITLEKIDVPGYSIIGFSVSLPSLLPGGSEVSQFSGKFVKFYTQENSTFQYGFVDTGESLAFSDVLKITYDESDNLVSSQSEIPQPPTERVSPFGFDDTSAICYPPYSISDPLLEAVAVDDSVLYSSPNGWYDVFWGDVTRAGLGGKTLTVQKSVEFRGDDAVEVISTPINFNPDFYTHKYRIDMPIGGEYDEDVRRYLGNNELVSDSYFLYANVGIEPIPDPVIPDPEEVVPIGPESGQGVKPGTTPPGDFDGSTPGPGTDQPGTGDGEGVVVEDNLADSATITSTSEEDAVLFTNTGAVSPLGAKQSYEQVEIT
jgi:hypothetical protein